MNTCAKNNIVREPFPDSLRAFALIGILISNIIYFHSSSYNMLLLVGKSWDSLEIVGHLFVKIFIQGKFWSVFSILFGASLFWASKFTKKSIQIKRMLIIFAIGLMHYLFIWSGDILLTYGICGGVLLACLYRDRIIFGVMCGFLILTGMSIGSGDYIFSFLGVVFIYLITYKNSPLSWMIGGLVLIFVYSILNLTLFLMAGEYIYQFFMSMHFQEMTALEKYSTALNYRVRDIGFEMSGFSILNILGTMAIGICIARFIFEKDFVLSGWAEKLVIILGISCLVLSIVFNFSHPFMEMWNHGVYLSLFSINYLLLTPIAVFYIYLFKKIMTAKPNIENYLSSAGKMSLSIYITQSIFWVGIGQMINVNQIHYLILIFFAIGFALIQIHLAKIYLNAFKYGPLEIIVKKLSK